MANASIQFTSATVATDVSRFNGEQQSRIDEEKKKIQELHAKEVGVGNPSEERANS